MIGSFSVYTLRLDKILENSSWFTAYKIVFPLILLIVAGSVFLMFGLKKLLIYVFVDKNKHSKELNEYLANISELKPEDRVFLLDHGVESEWRIVSYSKETKVVTLSHAYRKDIKKITVYQLVEKMV